MPMLLKLVLFVNVVSMYMIFVFQRNESSTYDGTFTMYTGKDDMELIGLFDLWNGEPYTPYYDSYCAYVNGTSGELWPPVKNYKRLSLFSSDICSTLAIDYEQDVNILGIEGRKYTISNFTFENGSIFPEQACFKGDRIVPSGIRDVSLCKYGAPAFVSQPHFYMADPVYREAIIGMEPNKTKHEMYLSFESETGIVMEANGRLQINLFIESIPNMSLFANIKPLYMPMIWFNQHATLTEQYSKKLKLLVILPNVGMYSGWGILGIGILIGLIWIAYLIFFSHKHKENETDLLIPREVNGSTVA